jgi:hypothetical protein
VSEEKLRKKEVRSLDVHSREERAANKTHGVTVRQSGWRARASAEPYSPGRSSVRRFPRRSESIVAGLTTSAIASTQTLYIAPSCEACARRRARGGDAIRQRGRQYDVVRAARRRAGGREGAIANESERWLI